MCGDTERERSVYQVEAALEKLRHISDMAYSAATLIDAADERADKARKLHEGARVLLNECELAANESRNRLGSLLPERQSLAVPDKRDMGLN